MLFPSRRRRGQDNSNHPYNTKTPAQSAHQGMPLSSVTSTSAVVVASSSSVSSGQGDEVANNNNNNNNKPSLGVHVLSSAVGGATATTLPSTTPSHQSLSNQSQGQEQGQGAMARSLPLPQTPSHTRSSAPPAQSSVHDKSWVLIPVIGSGDEVECCHRCNQYFRAEDNSATSCVLHATSDNRQGEYRRQLVPLDRYNCHNLVVTT